MLYIRNLDYLPDGRSVVDTIGLNRFRVIRRGMKDGYCTADIEDLEDIKVHKTSTFDSTRRHLEYCSPSPMCSVYLA